MSASEPQSFVILGAGVIGLTTALSLRETYLDAHIVIVAEYFPGDYHIDYTSPWAGGNWCSSATDNGILEACDRVTFERFDRLAREVRECGIKRSPLRMVFDQNIKDAEILSKDTGKVWYEELVGGLDPIPDAELPSGAVFGLDMRSTFVINTQVYLRWLLERCQERKVRLERKKVSHVRDAAAAAGLKSVSALFNCTGLGSYSLGGVEDKTMYPTRGQVVLVEQPLVPLQRMYFRSPRRVDNDTTYVFQRPLAGGVILGGCRENGNWSGEVDLDFAQQIMKRCCALAPELGRPEDLKVIKHGVGLRPSRRDGPRMEVERKPDGLLIVHNYGASGAGYQGSWGMAQHGVKLFGEAVTKSPIKAQL